MQINQFNSLKHFFCIVDLGITEHVLFTNKVFFISIVVVELRQLFKLGVVNAKNQVITGKQYPKLVTIKANFDGSILTLNAPGMDTIQAKIPLIGKTVYTEMFGTKCYGTDLGPEVGAWIAKHLDKTNLKLKLIYCDQGKQASIKQVKVRI